MAHLPISSGDPIGSCGVDIGNGRDAVGDLGERVQAMALGTPNTHGAIVGSRDEPFPVHVEGGRRDASLPRQYTYKFIREVSYNPHLLIPRRMHLCLHIKRDIIIIFRSITMSYESDSIP